MDDLSHSMLSIIIECERPLLLSVFFLTYNTMYVKIKMYVKRSIILIFTHSQDKIIYDKQPVLREASYYLNLTWIIEVNTHMDELPLADSKEDPNHQIWSILWFCDVYCIIAIYVTLMYVSIMHL